MKANRRPLAAVGRRSMPFASAACVFARRLSCVSANEGSREGVADRPGGTLRGLRFRRRPWLRPRASVRTKQDRKKLPRRRSCSRGIVEIGGPASPGGWPPSQFGGVRGSRKVQESPPAALSAVAWRMTRSVSPGPSTTRRGASARAWWSGRLVVAIERSSAMDPRGCPLRQQTSHGPYSEQTPARGRDRVAPGNQ